MPDTPARPTLLQRAVLWILHALMFYAVALHPVLLMARFQPDDVVHYGFLRWIAVVLVLYWAASQLFFTTRPVDTRPGRQTLAVTAGILLVFGVFTPIVSFPFVGDVDFFRAGYGDGYILLAMAGLSMALAVTGRWKQVLVPGLGALAVVLWTFLSVQGTVSQARSGAPAALAGNPHEGLAASVMQAIEWKWGWLLLFAGSGLLVYSAARRDELADEASPFAPAEFEDEAAAAYDEEIGEEPASAEPTAAAPVDDAGAEPAADEVSAPAEATADASASADDASAPTESTSAAPADDAGAGSVEAAAAPAAASGETEAAGEETAAPAGETRSAPTGAAAEGPAEPAATPESDSAEGPVTAAAETPAKPPETAAEQTPPATAGDAAADDAPPASQPAEVKASTPTPETAAAEPAAEGSGAPPTPEAAEESEAAANEPAAKTEAADTAEAAPAAESASKKD